MYGMLFVRADLPPPVPQPAPRTILFQRKRANRRILNEHMFLNVLQEFGQVGYPQNILRMAVFQGSQHAVPLVVVINKVSGCAE